MSTQRLCGGRWQTAIESSSAVPLAWKVAAQLRVSLHYHCSSWEALSRLPVLDESDSTQSYPITFNLTITIFCPLFSKWALTARFSGHPHSSRLPSTSRFPDYSLYRSPALFPPPSHLQVTRPQCVPVIPTLPASQPPPCSPTTVCTGHPHSPSRSTNTNT
jgi:hypothetical protein